MTKLEHSDVVEERHRMWASASFVAVLIVVGLPLWWKTTQVYRVSLPYEKISAMEPMLQRVAAELTIVARDQATADQLSRHIEDAFTDVDVIKLRVKKQVLTEEVRRALESAADEHAAVKELGKTYDIARPNSFHVVQKTPLPQHVWLATERVMFFRDENAGRTVAEALQRWVYQTATLAGARSDRPDAARRSRFPPGAAYDVVLSVVHPRPDRLRLDFSAADAVEDYVGSFADELSELHNFTLKSQWLHLLNFDFQAKEMRDESGSAQGRHHGVRQERLSQLLTRLEERGATRVSGAETINLALYVLPCELAPLRIYDCADKVVESPVMAFMSPRWGGVVLSSPSVEECAGAGAGAGAEPRHAPDVRAVMGAFVSHLRTMIGITEPESIEGAAVAPLRSVAPRRWEVDALVRVRALEQLSSAQRTLQSLARLLGEISNIVINDEVGASISAAVARIELASGAAARGALLEAYRASLQALRDAETAFTEPSLLALLYFPDDQKYAIYIPLFLPIMFPVVLSLRRLAQWLRAEPPRKEKAD